MTSLMRLLLLVRRLRLFASIVVISFPRSTSERNEGS